MVYLKAFMDGQFVGWVASADEDAMLKDMGLSFGQLYYTEEERLRFEFHEENVIDFIKLLKYFAEELNFEIVVKDDRFETAQINNVRKAVKNILASNYVYMESGTHTFGNIATDDLITIIEYCKGL